MRPPGLDRLGQVLQLQYDATAHPLLRLTALPALLALLALFTVVPVGGSVRGQIGWSLAHLPCLYPTTGRATPVTPAHCSPTTATTLPSQLPH